VLLTSLVVPLSALAFGTSFGGRIVAWIPCLSPLGPAIFITIVPAGVFPVTYIWAPGTIGLPPTHIGQQILGVADTIFGCKVGVVPLVGQRIQLDGVSSI
jgi:hypothetical protein